jgi:beta-xylosidase
VVGSPDLELPAPGWPLHPVPPVPVRDDFDDERLAPQWVSLRDRPPGLVTTGKRPGWLTLRARGASLDDRDVVFVGRRQQHHACRARALVDATEGSGGLAVRMDEQHHYEVEVAGSEIRLVARLSSVRRVVASQPAPPGPVVLRVDVTTPAPDYPGSGPDLVALGFEEPEGTFTALAALDGRYLSTEVAGGFTGRVIGVYAATGTVHVDWFDYEQLG